MAARLVSIVIPCYNYGRFLGDCVTSVLQQQYSGPLEAIVVDDGSSDETQEVLRSIRDPRLRVLCHEKNHGHVAALTAGFAAAQGDFIARLDADDRYRPNFLATLLPKLEQHPEAGVAYGEAALIDEQGRVTYEQTEHRGSGFQGSLLVRLLQSNFICSATSIGRREAWNGALPCLGQYPGKANDDWYYNVMIARRWQHVFIREVVAEYRVHPLNLHSRVILDGSEEAFVKWFLDWNFEHPVSDPALEAAKQAVRERAYGTQYASLAFKYFGAGMPLDARRCLWRAIRFRPSNLLRGKVLRLIAGSYIGLRFYDAVKRLALGRR